MLMLMCCYLCSCSPSLQISPSTTAMVTCVEEAEVRAAAEMRPPSKSLTNFTRAIQHQYSARYVYINEHAFWNICIMIHTVWRQGQQCCRWKPGSSFDSETINCESHFLSHVVLQSFRYVSHLLFHMACFLTLHHIFACSWATRGTLPWMHTAPLPLHACITVGLVSTTGHAVQHSQMPKHALPSSWTSVL